MPDLCVRLADSTDRPALERLWLMFQHDMSQFRGLLPRPDGTFRSERLHAAFHDPDWAAYLLTSDTRLVGFATVRGLKGETRVLSSFFIVRCARRAGLGLRGVRDLIAEHPGPWEVAFQDENVPAAQFWRRVATEIAQDAWTEQHRPVPANPGLPPDTWITFNTQADTE